MDFNRLLATIHQLLDMDIDMREGYTPDPGEVTVQKVFMVNGKVHVVMSDFSVHEVMTRKIS